MNAVPQTARYDPPPRVKGVPLPPDGILFMNKTAEGGLKHGTLLVRLLAQTGANVRNGTVLDVGCGWGRLAYGLLNVGFAGTYVGVDIVKDRIDWLTINFTATQPRYTFHFADVKNDLYNPGGTLPRIPFASLVQNAVPDAIVLLSVFTHMYENDIAGYLSDLSDIMTPRTSLVFTCFLFDGEAQAGISRGDARRQFRHELSSDCRYDIEGEPLAAIAYSEPRLLQLLRNAGLSGRIIRGSWSHSKTARDWGQDVCIARKIPD
jgi:SAM-dependent methyltransferase